MSALKLTLSGPIRRRSPSSPLARRLLVWGPVLPAFVISRLLSTAAGALGVLALHAHGGAASTAAMHQLGPLGDVLAGSADRFDSAYYLRIAAHGYGPASAGICAFFPLYPALIRVVAVLVRSDVLAGVIISSAAFLVALRLLHQLTETELGRPAADATVLLLCFAPLSFFFTAVYTESLFLALSVGSVFAARRGRWRLACGLGALAALTRPTGILLVVALGAVRIARRGRPERGLGWLAWLAAIPGALLGYMAALALNGYPLLGPLQAEGNWHRVTTGPLGGAIVGAWAALRGAAGIAGGAPIYRPALIGPFPPGAENVVLALVLAAAVGALVACVHRLPAQYWIYAGLMLAMCLSSPVPGAPLRSLDRYVLTIFPLWMAAGAWVARRGLQVPAVALGTLALLFYSAQFASWAFIA